MQYGECLRFAIGSESGPIPDGLSASKARLF